MTNVLDLIPDQIEIEKQRLIKEIKLVCWQVSPIVERVQDGIEREKQFDLFWGPIYDKLQTLSIVEIYDLIHKKGIRAKIRSNQDYSQIFEPKL